MPARIPIVGLGLMILGVALFSILNGVVKAQMEVFPVNQVLFFRNAFALPPLFLMMRMARVRAGRGNLGRHAALAVTFTLSLALIFGAYARLPLADATAIGFFQPLIVALMTLALGISRVNGAEWLSIGVGLCGILIVVQPAGGSGAGVLMALGGATFAAAGMIQQRSLSLAEPTAVIAFMTLGISALLTLPTLPLNWVQPTPAQLAGLVAMGLASGLCQFVTVRAAYHATAVMLAPVNYTKMIWAILIGYLWFQEMPTPVVLAGTGVILISTLISLQGSRRSASLRS